MDSGAVGEGLSPHALRLAPSMRLAKRRWILLMVFNLICKDGKFRFGKMHMEPFLPLNQKKYNLDHVWERASLQEF